MLWLVALLGVLIGVVGFGAIYQTLATNRDRRKFLPLGKSIDINGNSLHYLVMGEGNPTVIVDSGQGATHLDWQLVQPEVAQFTQIVTYDRAGYGWSDLSAQARTAEQVVDELRQLLQQAKISPPYVLVGMSLSGLFVRLFAYQHPEEVAGMVLVDVAHEQMYERIPATMVKLNQRFDWFAIHVLPLVARIGLFRCLVAIDKLPLAAGLFEKFPSTMQASAKAIYAQTKFWKAVAQESAAFPQSIQQIERASSTKPFPDIPLVVLSLGKADFGGTQELVQAMQELHSDLASQSSQGVHIIAERSGHIIQLDDPELVVGAICQVVEKVRYCKLS